MDEYDTDGTNEPVCPHCGKSAGYYAEMFSDGRYTCDACGVDFDLICEMSLSFTTTKPPPEDVEK